MMHLRGLQTITLAAAAVSWTALVACGGDDSTELPAGTGGTPDGGAAGAAGQDSVCGNAVVEGTEECDDGNDVPDDGCQQDCAFTCVAGSSTRGCDDGNPCNGDETCTDEHVCVDGTPLEDGADCGEGNVCVNGNCIPPSCGDGQIQYPEECDDGNLAPDDGCEADCRYTCVSTDPERDCSAGDACAGDATCDDATHTCTPGTPLDDYTECDNGEGYCLEGVCTAPACGNGVSEPGEDCDDGNTETGDGCELDCTFSCSSEADCDDSIICTQNVCDDQTHTCTYPADETQNGEACTDGQITGTCDSGQCIPTGCGNGVIDAGEECDNGTGNNGAGTGCTLQCQYECDDDTDCADSNICDGNETCVDVQGGKLCESGVQLDQGTVCQDSPRRICDSAGQCVESVCGDQYIDSGNGEVCDDGDLDPADGCTNDCQYTCTSGSDCSDGSVCTQDACDIATHTCSNPADTSQDGEACTEGGTSGTCQGGLCVPGTCGDGTIDGGEECDNGSGNNGPGTGCTASCQFECDTAQDCTNGNPCDGEETCVSVSGGQLCQDGASLNQGDSCGTNRICDATLDCVLSTCGDNWIDAAGGEDCDNGTGNNGPGTGCTTECQFECETSADCTDTNVCNGDETCVDVAGGKTCQGGTNLDQGNVCLDSPRSICDGNGNCVESICGDAYIDADDGEECDNGTGNNGAGTGCTTGCLYECHSDSDCVDSNICDGDETCSTVAGGQTCVSGANLAQGVECNASPPRICDGDGNCLLSECGDGYVDTTNGEECEPPGTAECTADCKSILCGDGVIAGDEECDDGNTTPLDGCDGGCRYEWFMRMNNVQLMFDNSPSWCHSPDNQFGEAFADLAQGSVQSSLQDQVTDGSMNIIVQALGLDDLAGVSDSDLELGVTSAELDPAAGAWPATTPDDAPMDWWYLLDPNSLDANDIPESKLTPASISARNLEAGFSDIALPIQLGNTVGLLEMKDSKITALVGSTTSVPAPPPSALASGLVVAETLDALQSGQGLCGNVTVDSLSRIPAPEDLVSNCAGTCGRTYTYCGAGNPVGPGCNSILDVLVGGCETRVFICVDVIYPKQPDVDYDANFGDLTLGTNNKVPTSQSDGNTDAYSAYFRFAAKRGHATNNYNP